MIRRGWLLPLLLAGGVAGAQTPVVRLDDPGEGQGPALLARALARPHVVIAPGTTRFVIPRDSTYSTSVIVLGRETAVEGRVEGDLIVVAADLYVRPRAVVNGQAVAIGGGLYESTMARVGATAAFRDFTYDITPAGAGFSLRYRSLYDRPATLVSWPGLFGLRLPAYDRSNGVSVRAGPLITPPGTTWRIEPRVTYRSQLGRVDPRLAATASMNSRSTFQISAERGTFTNEEWIWAEILNSAATLISGNDARNYYRASRAQTSMSRRWDWESSDAAPYIGARAERDYSVRPDSDVTSGPWSFTGRTERDDMRRPNPQIDEGYIYSGLAGVAATWSKTSLTARLAVDGEFGAFYPLSGTAAPSAGLAQTTIDGSVTFPTFGLQSIRVDGHFVVTLTGNTPRQRWAYVGGPGSVSTLENLERGGDQLVFVDFRYNIPITAIVLPFVGSPVFTIRELLAGADVGRFPSIAQAIGARATVGPAYVQLLYDPSDRHARFSAGLTLLR